MDLSSDFNTNEYLQRTLHLTNYDSEQSKLTQSLNNINNQLHDEVSRHYEGMLGEVESLAAIGDVFQEVSTTATSLQSCVGRLRRSLQEPYDTVTTAVQQLSNMYATIELLRALTRYTALVSKLKEYDGLNNVTDLPRAAKTLRDIETIMGEVNFHGIHAVDSTTEFVGRMSSTIRTKTNDLLSKTLQSTNHSDLSVALQVTYNLGTLGKVVQNIIAERKKEINRVLTRELDPQVIQKAVAAAEGNGETEGARTRSIVLGKLELTLQHTAEQLNQVVNLFSVIKRKRDPTTQQLFSAVLVQEGIHVESLREDLWEKTAAAIKDKVHRLCKRPNIMLLFVSEYARVAHIFHKFVMSSLKEFVVLVSSSAEQAESTGPLWIKDVLGECEQRFVADSLEKLQERSSFVLTRITQSIPKDPDQPADAALKIDAKSLGKVALQEVTILRSDPMLLPLVLRNIHTVVSGLHIKCKETLGLVKGVQIVQVANPATAGQAFHAAVHNVLGVVHYDITTLVESIPQELLEDAKSPLSVEMGHIHKDLYLIEQTCTGIFTPLANAVVTAVNKLLVQMHSEDYTTAGTTTHGRYAGVVEARITHISKRILSLYEKDSWIQTSLASIATRILSSACRNVVLVRPVSDDGRARLVSELQVIGQSIGHLHAIENLGPAYNVWKAVRRVLAMPYAQFIQSSEFHNGVLTPVIALHVIMQHIPPTSMTSLQTRLKMSLQDYIEWLDDVATKGGDYGPLADAAGKCVLEYQSKEEGGNAADCAKWMNHVIGMLVS